MLSPLREGIEQFITKKYDARKSSVRLYKNVAFETFNENQKTAELEYTISFDHRIIKFCFLFLWRVYVFVCVCVCVCVWRFVSLLFLGTWKQIRSEAKIETKI